MKNSWLGGFSLGRFDIPGIDCINANDVCHLEMSSPDTRHLSFLVNWKSLRLFHVHVIGR